MLPLALIMKNLGHSVRGSDRANDQGKVPEKFSFIKSQGIELTPQDGSGPLPGETLIVSTAVEDTIPDVKSAKEQSLTIMTRAQLLSQTLNQAETGITIAGTSGKSTTTGMAGFLLQQMNQNPTVMNGAIFRNYVEENPWCCALSGREDLFISEVDESDGSISLYDPAIAVLTNISLDHKSLDELHSLFSSYLAKAQKAVLNLDDPAVAKMANDYRGQAITFSLENETANLCAQNITLRPDGSSCTINGTKLNLGLPGRHNIANALAALGIIHHLGLPFEEACEALGQFRGVRRRLEVIGTTNGITIIDDFAHNPDKIAASLSTLRHFEGRLLIMFQPHGFGPLRTMRNEIVESFACHLGKEDQLLMPEPYYAGGTVDRSVSSTHIVSDLKERGIRATVYPDRASCTPDLLATARAGDRIIIMGARDDTLSDYAKMLLEKMEKRHPA